MKLSLFIILILAVLALAQTPLEFGIVQDLVGGTPRISVFSIKTVSLDGAVTLQIAIRAGILMDCTRHSMLVDTMTASDVLIDGQINYSASLMIPVVEHFFTVIKRNMAEFGAGGISRIQADLITSDEMGWISVNVPLSRVDSLLAGEMSHIDFWAVTPLREVEVGTLGFPVANASPLPDLHGAPAVQGIVPVSEVHGNCAWKSLILPGWGQMCSGSGLPVVNILAEIGGAALLFTDDYREAGIGIISLNHLISFTDLL